LSKSRHGSFVHGKKFSRRSTQKYADKKPINIGRYANRRIIRANSPFKRMCQSHLLRFRSGTLALRLCSRLT
jgi:hypothetical protein